MPLNHDLGEPIDGLGPVFRVVPNAKWRETSMFEQAATIAAEAFMDKGALLPITFDDREVLTQEHMPNVLLFIFCKSIRGQEHFSVREFKMPDDMIRELKALGKWESSPPFN
jgi:hypothetical protein